MSDVYKAPSAQLMTDSENNSGMGSQVACPPGVKGWSWGAFLLNWIWAIGNKTWIGLLAFIPYIGFVVAIVLGFKGREWAWKNKRWDSLEHFNRVQRRWSFWGLILTAFFIGAIALAIVIPVLSQQGAA